MANLKKDEGPHVPLAVPEINKMISNIYCCDKRSANGTLYLHMCSVHTVHPVASRGLCVLVPRLQSSK